jgi:hypothetical protein
MPANFAQTKIDGLILLFYSYFFSVFSAGLVLEILKFLIDINFIRPMPDYHYMFKKHHF